MCETASRAMPPVMIAGCGAVTAVGHGVEALRSAMRTNSSGLRPSLRFEGPRFQSSVVGAVTQDGSNGEQDDPAYQLANEALEEAREQAAARLRSISAERIGLVLSTTKANIEALERLADNRSCSDFARRHLQANLLAAD